MKRAFIAIVLAFAARLSAADLSGDWTLKAPSRDATLQLVLKQDGDSLGGTVVAPRRQYPIKKGSVDSLNHVEMVLGGKGPLAGMKITGAIDGDHLRLTMNVKGRQTEAVAERTQ